MCSGTPPNIDYIRFTPYLPTLGQYLSPEAVGNALLDERVRTFVGENRQ